MIKRVVAHALLLFFGFVCAGVIPAVVAKAAAPSRDAVVKADRAVVQDLEQGNWAAAKKKWLDRDFTWITSDGIMWSEEDAFRARLKPLIPDASQAKITEHKYGNVIFIQENVGHKYVAHFWVRRPQGWRLLHTNEIDIGAYPKSTPVWPDYAVPANNPCKMLPYKPLSQGEQEALEGWRDEECVKGHHDSRLGNNLRAVHSDGVAPPKSVRIEETKKLMSNPAYRKLPKVGFPPVLYMRTWDFGTAVVAIMLQPSYGGKAFWSSRIFGDHNGYWRMDESYHTTIQAAPVMTALPPHAKSAAGRKFTPPV